MAELSELAGYVKTASKYINNRVDQLIKDPFNEETFISSVSALSEAPNSPLWKRVIAWERSRAASGYGIIWGDADPNKQEEYSAECHSMDWF